jgi:uncharacterized protein (DUF1697 family)
VTRYVAFLRAINVAGHARVEMSRAATSRSWSTIKKIEEILKVESAKL